MSTREYPCGYSTDFRPIAHLSGAPAAVSRTRACTLGVLTPCDGRPYPPSTPTPNGRTLSYPPPIDRPTASAQIDTDELIVAADPSASPSALADALALAPSAAGGGGACVRDIRGAFGAVDRRAAAVLLRNVEVAPERSNYTNCWRSAPSRARSLARAKWERAYM